MIDEAKIKLIAEAADKIQAETQEKFHALAKEHGFQLLYSPPKVAFALLIENPGPGKKS